MIFSELRTLDPLESGLLPLDDVRRLMPTVPDDVLLQVCVAHGLNGGFREQYGEIDFDRISWRLESVAAEKLTHASVYEPFRLWVESVTRRAKQWDTKSWNCIDSRPDVIEHWETFKTWKRPPVLIAGSLVDRNSDFHLVEGHTRLGTLIGLTSTGVLPMTSLHQVWFGRGV